MRVANVRCRHRRSWLICGGWAEWCYECGAWRQLRAIAGTNRSAVAGRWTRPVGKGGENPAI